MRKGKALNFERLENRRLLAADLGYDVMQCCDIQPNEECMVAPEIAESTTQEVFVDPLAPDEGPANPDTLEPAISLDLSDGMDGYFGTLDAENSSDTLQFTADADGMVDVVVASSFGEHSTQLTVSDAEGNLIAASSTESLDGFQTLSFAAQADQTYDLTVDSADGGQGNFQVTIGLDAATDDITDPGPTNPDTGDSHEDVVEDTTEDVCDETMNEDTDVSDDNESDEPIDQGPAQDDSANEDPVDEDCDEEGDSTEEEETELGDACSDDSDDSDSDPTDAGPADDSEPELPVDDVIDNGGVDPVDDCVDEGPAIVDLHANEIGETATELQIVDGIASIAGDLESVDDTDVFRFNATGTGEISLYAGELSEGSVDLDVNVYDSDGNIIVDGATNEAVKITFSVEKDAEYFVSINSGETQTGTYEVLLELTEDATEPAIVDDHTNEIGDDATTVVTSEGTGQATGELETDSDTDAFRLTADADGEIVLDVQVSSEAHESDAQISVFNTDGELVVDGTTNETVGLRFDAAANAEYHVLVDSLNDVPMSYELTSNEFPTSVDAGPVGTVEADLPLDENTTDGDDCEEALQMCTFENPTDEVFSELGDDETDAGPLAADDNSIDDLFANTEFQWAFSFDGDRFYSRFTGV